MDRALKKDPRFPYDHLAVLGGRPLRPYPGCGQDACAICGGDLRNTQVVVGCGTGAGEGRDGHFAHEDCYKAELKEAAERMER